MENKIILSNNISHDILSRDNYLQYKNLVNNFHSRFDRFTKVLNNIYKEISDDPSYDNKIYNVSTLLILNDASEEIMAYCSFCCSSVKSSVGTVIPAIEITTFALNEKYCGNVYIDIIDDKVKCSDYLLEACMGYFKSIQQEYIYACLIHLHSESNNKVQNFYIRNGFRKSNSYYKYLYDAGNNPEMYFFRLLDD